MENEVLKYWLEGNYPAIVKIAILIILTVILIIRFMPREMNTLITNSVSKLFKLMLNSETLETNLLFYAKDRLFKQIEAVDLQDDRKERLFKLLLKNKVEVTIDFARDFVKKNKDTIKDWSPVEFKMNVETLYQDIKNEYRLRTLNDFCNIYGLHKGGKIFDYIYNRGFKPYHKNNTLLVETVIESVSLSKIKSNLTKLDNILTVIYATLEVAISDIEKTFDSFNGEFEKIINS